MLIELLESRSLCSAAAHAALMPLRVDIAKLPQPISTMIWAFHSQLRNVSAELKMYANPTDSDLITGVLGNFGRDAGQLTVDARVSQILMVRDINRLSQDLSAAARHPTNQKIAAWVVRDENILQNQGQSSQTSLLNDCALTVSDYFSAVPVIDATHKIDATLAQQANATLVTMTQFSEKVETCINQIANQEIPAFIAAADPASTNNNAA